MIGGHLNYSAEFGWEDGFTGRLHHVAQVNAYAGTAQSNGVEFDKGVVFSIHGSEEALGALAKIADRREENPSEYAFWVNTLMHRDVPGINLKVSPVRLDPKLMQVIERVAHHYFDNFVAQGKLLVPDEKVVLAADVSARLKELRDHSAELLAAKAAVERCLDSVTSEVGALLAGANPSKVVQDYNHAVKISGRTSLDREAAEEALAAEGITADTHGENKGVSVERLLEAYKALGGDPDDPALQEKTLSVKIIRAKLKEVGIDAAVYEKCAISLSLSNLKKDQISTEALISGWVGRLTSTAEDDPMPDQSSSENPALSMM